MDTPLVMSGFAPTQSVSGSSKPREPRLEPVAAGGSLGGTSAPTISAVHPRPCSTPIVPGSAVSMQLIRGDLEISATCTVTYVDPKQLLACGHPVLGAGPVSLPMTTADVVTTLASPLNAFKIINTGVTIGAFTQDRESAIRGVFGAQAHMIPMHIAVDAPEGPRKVNVDILDLPSLTPLAMQVVLYQSLLQTNESSEALSYHVTGNIDLAGFPPVPLDLWAAADGEPRAGADDGRPSCRRAVHTPLLEWRAPGRSPRNRSPRPGNSATRIRSRSNRRALFRAISSTPATPVQIEATLRPWQQPERNVRIAVKLPARLASGNLRLLVSDGATLDRTLLQPRLSPGTPAPDLATVLAEARNQHPADRIYVSLLAPETQGEIDGETLTSLPLSVANALEPLRNAQECRPERRIGRSSPAKHPPEASSPASRFSICTSSRAAV